jgi:hypothetical protein
MNTRSLRTALLASASIAVAAGTAQTAQAQAFFERVATYPVFENLPEGTDPATETVAEIVAATADGMTLVYTDGENAALGLVDISDPAAPQGLGEIDVGGEPTSVAVAAGTALAGVNTSENFTDPSGHVVVVDIADRSIVETCDVGGQPDSVAVSPDGAYLAIAIENERDEDLNEGEIPQLPAGYLAIFDLDDSGMPTNCDSVRTVELTGLAEVAPSDPEPEFVDINDDNVAVVTLQENNHLVLVDVAEGTVVGDFSAGTVDLEAVDTEDDGIVQGTGSLSDVPREPDAVSWIDGETLVTANEGDYRGGSRGITVFDTSGEVLYDSGNAYEHLGMALGHYPDDRADNKGMEPEGAAAATFGDDSVILVLSERGNTVTVYRGTEGDLEVHQVLPTALGPEGVVAIPERDLFAVSTEEDDAEEGIRATISIYTRTAEESPYPDIRSVTDPETGAPIGWGALSGMVADDEDADTVYTVSDSFYSVSRIYTVDVSSDPAEITDYVDLTRDGQPAAHDLEGIALREGGGFWVVSEGHRGRETLNLLMAVAEDGTIEQTIDLPEEVSATMTNNGFEGVTAWVGEDGNEHVAVVVQRSWEQDPAHHTLLGFYDVAAEEWAFAHTPIAEPTSPAGGWVGQSEITYLGDDRFLLIERDNQPGSYSTHKVLTVVSTAGIEPQPFGEDLPVAEREVVFDLLPVLREDAGWIGDKPEGIAITQDGTVYLSTDNDGVDDAHGQTQFIELGSVEEIAGR